MKIFKRQRGQTIVEFALVFPFFCMLFFAIVYCGFLTADYVTLNSAASRAVREAALNSGTLSSDSKDAIKDLKFFNSWYKVDEVPNPTVNGTTVTVMLQAKLHSDNVVLKKFLPEAFTVKQSMYYYNG